MFRRLRYRIALQFTGLVFALMLVVGGAFIGVQYFGTHRSTNDQLRADAAQFETKLAEASEDGAAIQWPPRPFMTPPSGCSRPKGR